MLGSQCRSERLYRFCRESAACAEGLLGERPRSEERATMTCGHRHWFVTCCHQLTLSDPYKPYARTHEIPSAPLPHLLQHLGHRDLSYALDLDLARENRLPYEVAT